MGLVKVFTTYQSYRKSLKKKKTVKKVVKKKSNLSPKEKYQAFLKTNYWFNVREKVLKRDGYKCQNCGSKRKLQVHHKTYKHHYKEHKHLKDLVTLCEPCHQSIHKKS